MNKTDAKRAHSKSTSTRVAVPPTQSLSSGIWRALQALMRRVIKISDSLLRLFAQDVHADTNVRLFESRNRTAYLH